MEAIVPKPARIRRRDFHIRISDDEKSDVAEAARLEGFQSAGAFIRYHAIVAARTRLHLGFKPLETK